MSDRLDVVIVGAGQAGLATSHELAERGVSHLVLEKGLVGQTWRGRWDSFCLVTPNRSMRLPDHPYDGENPDAFDPPISGVGSVYSSSTDSASTRPCTAYSARQAASR